MNPVAAAEDVVAKPNGLELNDLPRPSISDVAENATERTFKLKEEEAKAWDALIDRDNLGKRKLIASVPEHFRREVMARAADFGANVKAFDQMTARDVLLEINARFVAQTAEAAAGIEAAIYAPFTAEQLSCKGSFMARLDDMHALLHVLPKNFKKTFEQIRAHVLGMFKAFPLGHEIIRIYTDMTLDASQQSSACLATWPKCWSSSTRRTSKCGARRGATTRSNSANADRKR